MTFEEYLEAAITQLERLNEFAKEHYDECAEPCAYCAMYVLIPSNIATIKAALASEEVGLCDDPNCINNIAYTIAEAFFKEIERKENAQTS